MIDVVGDMFLTAGVVLGVVALGGATGWPVSQILREARDSQDKYYFKAQDDYRFGDDDGIFREAKYCPVCALHGHRVRH